MRMRFVDLPLKMKLFWAFAAFIMIALALSIMSIYTLWHFDRGLHSLTTDMRPELTFVSDLSKQTQQLANSVHSYVLLGKSDHYQEAEKRIESLRELISGKERMVDNRPEMKRFEELAVKYEELIREAYRLDRDISRVRTTIGQYETRYTEDCRRILNDQESLLQKDVARGAGTGLRTKNLKIVGSLLDTGNRISLQERTANFSNGEIFAGEVDSLFYTIDGDLESLRLSIRGSQSVALVEALYNTVSVFRDALTDFSGLLQKQASLLNEHREIFDRLTVSAENLYADVIQNAVATSESFSGKIAGSIARNSVMVLLTAAIALFLAVFISRQITRPLSKGVAFAQSISRGDLTVKLAVERKDEIGDLALNLQQMSEVMRQTIASVTSAADNMANASMELSATSQNVSQGSSEQASSAEEMSSAMEQMSANIRQNMEHAKATEKISSAVEADVFNGKKKVDSTVEAIREIAGRISVIGDIAFQTNILALNAAVEAARAGEHGRGFGVVASEIGKLAERSKLAAQEIEKLTRTGVGSAEEAGQIMNEIVPEVNRTSALIREIAEAGVQQDAAAEQINLAIQQLNYVTQQNAAASEELATNAVELSSQAESLQHTVSFFKVVREEGTRMLKQKPEKRVLHTADRSENKNKGVILNLNDDKDPDFERF